ncbi:kelch-like protein 6 isoform X1 [Drosophila sechellia]|uniref:GM20186 n=1 Tax=Drosophila sechellia TaxID=7238 RepID=B4HRP3_DROSE|nr:kelch-like protein 6 isoform X1 [Drosophila sechellia]EDW47907.1 GM20186 [Drosophila sechellia]
MEELMRQQQLSNGQKSERQELTCSVLFTNPKFRADKSSTKDEINSIARMVSNAEDLELDRVFRKVSKNDVEETRSLNRSLFEFGHNFEDADGWLKLEQPCKDQLATVLRYMFESHLKTTVQIEINNMYFNCHFIVLQVYSRFFSELEMIPLLVTLPENTVSQKAFMLSYKWMLSDEPVLELAHIVEVYVAATYLRITGLEAHCWSYFDDVECYNEDTACALYVESKDNPAMDVVRNMMLTRIRKFLLTFVATKEFLDLPTSHLIYLLDSDEICVNTEIEVFFIAVRWLGHNWNKRKVHIRRLMSCIRFNLMPLWYLLYARREEDHSLVMELIFHPEVEYKIDDSIAKITSRMYAASLEGNDAQSEDYASDSGQRNWICDNLCSYYHGVGCPNTREICFKHFEDYLLELQQCSKDHWSQVIFQDPSKKIDCCSSRKIKSDDLVSE